jgi:hypothetical protein
MSRVGRQVEDPFPHFKWFDWQFSIHAVALLETDSGEVAAETAWGIIDCKSDEIS